MPEIKIQTNFNKLNVNKCQLDAVNWRNTNANVRDEYEL